MQFLAILHNTQKVYKEARFFKIFTLSTSPKPFKLKCLQTSNNNSLLNGSRPKHFNARLQAIFFLHV